MGTGGDVWPLMDGVGGWREREREKDGEWMDLGDERERERRERGCDYRSKPRTKSGHKWRYYTDELVSGGPGLYALQLVHLKRRNARIIHTEIPVSMHARVKESCCTMACSDLNKFAAVEYIDRQLVERSWVQAVVGAIRR